MFIRPGTVVKPSETVRNVGRSEMFMPYLINGFKRLQNHARVSKLKL